jgi:REP element-mobilizing transposase RayT
MTYFITFSCYGHRVHGDETGSVDRQHRLYGSRSLEPDPKRAAAERKSMKQSQYSLDETHRALVLSAMHEVCSHRGWTLLAAHVRSNHIHAVLDADTKPEKILNDFKSYASRSLNRLALDQPDRNRWAHHGSTRWLWKRDEVSAAIHYVFEEQGEPMTLFDGRAAHDPA